MHKIKFIKDNPSLTFDAFKGILDWENGNNIIYVTNTLYPIAIELANVVQQERKSSGIDIFKEKIPFITVVLLSENGWSLNGNLSKGDNTVNV